MPTPTETSTVRQQGLDDPRLLTFLPMIYVAWADGDLSEAEMTSVCEKASAVTGVGCDDLLGPWLDPQDPPTAVDLQRVLRTIRSQASGMTRTQKLSLTDLGIEIATLDEPLGEDERDALSQVEDALGVAGAEAVRELLAEPRPAEVAASASYSFEPTALQAVLDADHPEIRNELRTLLSQPEFAYPEEQDRDRFRDHVLGWCRKLAERRYGSIAFPERFGGRDDYALFSTLFETMALHDLSLLIKFGVQFGLFGGSIFQLGTAKHHDKYLDRVGSLELPGCFAMTESGHGSNVRDLETTATYDQETDEFVIATPHHYARKDYIGNAARHGQLATVFAQLHVGDEEHGVHALLVPIRDQEGASLPGIDIEDCGHKMGLNGVDNGRLKFDHVRVPRENLLDRFASVDRNGNYESPIPGQSARFFTMLGTLVGGRVNIALAGLSVSKSALTIAIRYGGTRRQFGEAGEAEIPILDYLTHQKRLLPRLAKTYALEFALKDLKARFADPNEDRKLFEGQAAGLKAISTWHATDTVQTCRECCGGAGYLSENRFAALKGDSDVFTTFEGDNVVLLQLVAKGLLSGYRQQFQDLTAIGLVRFLAARATTAVAELNPVITQRTSEEHLRDPEFHLAAFSWREEHLLGALARRLKGRIDRGMSTQDALIEVQDHLVETARAHVDRRILARFTEVLAARAQGPETAVLERLRQLYAVSSLEANRGWFQEHGYFGSSKSKAIRALVNKLCSELRPDAIGLVEAFGIPDELLSAAILNP